MKQLKIDRYIDEPEINNQIKALAPKRLLTINDANVVNLIESTDRLMENQLRLLNEWTVDITDCEVADILNSPKIQLPSCIRRFVTKYAARYGVVHPVFTEPLTWNYKWYDNAEKMFSLVCLENPDVELDVMKGDQIYVGELRVVVVKAKCNGGRITPESYIELRR